MQLTTRLKSGISFNKTINIIIVHCQLHWLFSFRNIRCWLTIHPINLKWPDISNFPFVLNRIWYINHGCQSFSLYPTLVISSLLMLLQWRFTWRLLVSFTFITFCTVHIISDSIHIMVFLVAIKVTIKLIYFIIHISAWSLMLWFSLFQRKHQLYCNR